MPASPFTHVHIDLAGPFKTPLISIHGKILEIKKPINTHVVLRIDYFIKAADFYVIFSACCRGGRSILLQKSIVMAIVRSSWCTSDNGSEFGAEFKHMLHRLGIQHIPTSACHPAANGAVEWLVTSFKDCCGQVG